MSVISLVFASRGLCVGEFCPGAFDEGLLSGGFMSVSHRSSTEVDAAVDCSF